MVKSKTSPTPLSERIERARAEQRLQHALELARQLAKQEPTEANRELLRQVTLERGRELVTGGRVKDAAVLYRQAQNLGSSPEYVRALAAGLAACGSFKEAQDLLAKLPDDTVARAGLLKQAADAAFRNGPAGRATLPADQQPTFDAVLNAFGDFAAGRDEEARTKLQGIGLQSPFLEWKILLRGLLAYAAGDDARALDNLQRLDPERLPYRLASPLRFRLDKAFAAAQPPATQTALGAQSARLFDAPLIGPLRHVQRDLAKDNLGPTFRMIEGFLPSLRRDFPQLVPRLGDCIVGRVLGADDNEDELARYVRVFGPSPDDPRLHRLLACDADIGGELDEAHEYWQQYLKDVPECWPADQLARVQALIWAHMGDNAVKRQMQGAPPSDFFFEPAVLPFLQPDAEHCYRKSLELAPDRLVCWVALFELCRRTNKPKLEEVGRQLLEHFPDHAETLEALGDACADEERHEQAQDYYERAQRANPLARSVRGKLAKMAQQRGLALALDGRLDDARGQYEATLRLRDGLRSVLLCQLATLELKARAEARAAELIAQAEAEPDQRVACRYTLLAEGQRLKLSLPRRKAAAAAFEEACAIMTPRERLAALEAAAEQRQSRGKTLTNQKKWESRLLHGLNEKSLAAYDEKETERLLASVLALNARRPANSLLFAAQCRYRQNPTFLLLQIDYVLQGSNVENQAYRLPALFLQAMERTSRMPDGEAKRAIHHKIESQRAALAEILAPTLDLYRRFGPPPEFFDIFDDEDEP